MANYALDNAWEQARRRLALLEQHLDPMTYQRLTALGVSQGWQVSWPGTGPRWGCLPHPWCPTPGLRRRRKPQRRRSVGCRRSGAVLCSAPTGVADLEKRFLTPLLASFRRLDGSRLDLS